jgi:Zn ribbon nucleic-acid-binding protein
MRGESERVTKDPERYRGRPCPRCSASSAVVKNRDDDEGGVRIRRCVDCGYRWPTIEVDLVALLPYLEPAVQDRLKRRFLAHASTRSQS